MICKAFVLSYLSRAFAYPTEELLKTLLEGVEDLLLCLKELNIDFDIKSLEISIRDTKLLDIQGDYTDLFLLALRAPLSEISYELDKTARRAYELADISGFYKAFGLEISQGIEPDNLQTELEFLSLLLQKAIILGEGKDKEGVEVCLKAYESFLKDHLGRWYEVFEVLVDRNAKTEFYKILASLLKIFIDKETSNMKIQKLFDYKKEMLEGSSWVCET